MSDRRPSVLALLALLTATACGAHPYLLPSTKLVRSTADQTLGDRWYRMELSSGQRIGFMHLQVAAATGEPKAAYVVRSQGVFAMGPVEMSITETARLDEALAVVSLESEKAGQAPGKEATRGATTLTRTKDGWERTLSEGKKDRCALSTPYYDVTPGIALLLERLPLADEATWTLPSLLWKEGQPGEKAVARTIKIEVRAAKFQHDGAEVDGFEVTITKADRPGEDVIHTDRQGRMLRMSTSGAPIRLVASTEDGAKKEDAPIVVDPSTPQYPFMRFLEVVAGLAEADVLDQVVDWDALFASAAEQKGIEPPSAEARDAAIAEFKAKFQGKAKGELDAQMIRMVVGMVTVQIEGDRATIFGPGAGKKPFSVERRGDHWVLVAIPN